MIQNGSMTVEEVSKKLEKQVSEVKELTHYLMMNVPGNEFHRWRNIHMQAEQLADIVRFMTQKEE